MDYVDRTLKGHLKYKAGEKIGGGDHKVEG